MATITIKIEGIDSFSALSAEKARRVIEEGEKVIDKHDKHQANLIRSYIPIGNSNHTHLRSLIKDKIDGKGKTFVVGHVGTLGASAKDAIAFNAYNYGHAAPGKAGGVKVVPGSGVMQKASDEDKSGFKSDMKEAIKRAVES